MELEPGQIPLPFAAPRRQTLADFIGPANDELVTLFSRAANTATAYWLHGPSGCGKTHLLKGLCDVQSGYGRRCAYVDASEARGRLIDDLQSCTDRDIVAIDGSGWLGDVETEKVLVALYQTLLSNAGWIVVAAPAPATKMTFALADLASRWRAAQTFAVHPLSETELRSLLVRQARDRGLRLSPAVVDYWLTHRDRSLVALLSDFERLDEASWQSQRKITVPFMKGVLEP